MKTSLLVIFPVAVLICLIGAGCEKKGSSGTQRDTGRVAVPTSPSETSVLHDPDISEDTVLHDLAVQYGGLANWEEGVRYTSELQNKLPPNGIVTFAGNIEDVYSQDGEKYILISSWKDTAWSYKLRITDSQERSIIEKRNEPQQASSALSGHMVFAAKISKIIPERRVVALDSGAYTTTIEGDYLDAVATGHTIDAKIDSLFR